MIQPNPKNSPGQKIKPEVYARLKAEAAAPYRGLRKFLYIGFAASGLIGGLIFLTQILAGRDVENAVGNLGVQIAVIALMIFFWKLENRR